ncbi:MAG: dUTP diphosphatase [Candidatus Magasanikbacteria bacterium CG10_big_fil_rev_8_21_14_0_10_36_32]|uniref:dUTP diphosphatase n=1 Tax=Candidatus Magasanikbacteria bacterium CG10_big_fil_rev_8_21_14_0_10_36_32 TaxID=1974646 RepID=A0A2M6W6S7_9BACT|nr:MAG: dUTP diphosphatase [Candidatus Magasanikbacteria bacterium CG10_big_fil_rev_8_21_14_0_10_36_32]
MQIKIKRLDKTLPLPKYHTDGAAAFDFYARESGVIEPKTIKQIPTNLIIATPPGFMMLIASRSSLGVKKGLMLSNCVGILDSDYCGPKDEILLSLHNFTDKPITVERGERLAQGIIIKIEQADWNEVEEMDMPTRGGFGSTGK